MRIRIKADRTQLIAALNRAPKEVSRVLKREQKKQMRDIAKEAKANHRFQAQSHNLERSIRPDKKLIESSFGLRGRVYLETGIAIYGPRIHKGFGSWRPDPFLRKAGERLKPQVVKGFERAIAKALKKAGL